MVTKRNTNNILRRLVLDSNFRNNFKGRKFELIDDCIYITGNQSNANGKKFCNNDIMISYEIFTVEGRPADVKNNFTCNSSDSMTSNSNLELSMTGLQ